MLMELVEVPYGPADGVIELLSPSTQASKFRSLYQP